MKRRALLWLAAAAGVALLFQVLRPDEENAARAPRPAPEVPAAVAPPSEGTAAATERGAIVLDVADAANGEPLRGVDLVLRDARDAVLEAAFGQRDDAFRAEGLAPGAYVVSVGAQGYGPVSIGVEVRPGARVPVDAKLLRNPAIHGFVADRSGAPLGGILVTFGWAGGDGALLAYTSANGAFHIRLPRHDGPEWNGYLTADDPRGVYASTRRRLATPTEGVERVVLSRATRVVGRLVPRPADAVRVHLSHGEGGEATDVRLAPDGSFVVADLPPGQDIRLTILVPGNAALVRGPFRLEEEEQRDLGDLEVGRGRSLSFAVRSTAGDAAQDLRVAILLPAVDEARVVECSSHVAHLDLLPDGPILLRVAARGLGDRWVRIDKVAEFTRSEIKLVPRGTVEAQVLDADGRPAEGFVIRLVEDRPTFEETVFEEAEVELPPTDGEGRTRVQVGQGVHVLRVDGGSTVVEVRSERSTSVEIRLQRDAK